MVTSTESERANLFAVPQSTPGPMQLLSHGPAEASLRARPVERDHLQSSFAAHDLTANPARLKLARLQGSSQEPMCPLKSMRALTEKPGHIEVVKFRLKVLQGQGEIEDGDVIGG